MRTLLPVFAVFAVSAACSTTPPSRTVQGRLTGTSAQPLVLSETASGRQTATVAGAGGSFTIEVPTEQPVTLLVAEREGARVRVVRRIGPRWFVVKPGNLIELGTVRPVGTLPPELTPLEAPAPQICPAPAGQAELPYDAKVALGQTWRLADAFAEKGAQPARVVSVEMEGSTWRLAELRSGAAFTVTQADCDHVGNRDIGRDRAVITWENVDGSVETDHLDMRYCEADDASSSGSAGGTADAEAEAETCEHVDHEGCGDSGSTCDDDSELVEVEMPGACPAEGTSSPPIN
ncbi:MAG: hypothetical protein JNK82_41395 [Myxococcaceae bacterium]|nr:hypothetical protein [Myxococcaceae bacterium]